MSDAIMKGMLLGLGAAAPIGPVNVEIARRALRAGMPAGFFLGMGAVTVDVFYAALTSIGLRSLTTIPALNFLLSVGGIVILGYLGFSCIRAAAKSSAGDWVTEGAAVSRRSGYTTGLMMTLFNPMTLAFWFLAVPQLTSGYSGQLPVICIAVFLVTLTWVVAFSSLMGFLGRYRRASWLVIADLTGGVILLGFAAVACVRFIRSFL